MTPITDAATVSSVAAALEVAAEKTLRDVAWVLKLTSRIKSEMTAEHAPEKVSTARAGEGALVA